MSPRRPMLLAALCCALGGCALLGKSDPVVPRYFTPLDDTAPPPPAKPQTGLRLHLGRIEGLSHLREPIATRNSAQEITYADDRRWTERPEIYLRRTLSAALFEQRGVVESMTGRGPTLDVQLTAFEELLKPEHRVRMQAVIALHDEHASFLQETLTFDQPVAGTSADPALVIDAFREALRAGTAQIADRVVAKLGEAAPAGQ